LTQLKIISLESTTADSTWDEYVIRHPRATGYHLMAWRQVIQKVFGHRTFYLRAEDDEGNIRGVLPLVFLSSALFGRFLVSLPFVNYGGLLTDGYSFQVALLDKAIELAKNLGADHIELRHEELPGLGWPKKQHKVSMRLDLPRDFETLWKKFPAKLRSQVRRAEKEQMTFRVGRDDVLQDFYGVFSKNMRDLGTPIYSRLFFEDILRSFPSNSCIGIVYLNGKPVAAGFLYGFRDVLEIPWAASDRLYNRLAPNMLLYASILNYACRQRFQVFDFGRSTPGTGTYRFKQQWGARAVQLNWHYWLPKSGSLPNLSPTNTKFRWAILAWRKMPLLVAQHLGPSISRCIP
jgi:serine/alanine adding enzyme